MNRMKKFASLFLSFLLILSALPSAVYAEENTLQEIEAGILEVTAEESVKEEDISNAVSDENIVGIEAEEEASTLNAMEGMCGDSLEWEISNSGVLTISGYGEMENYSSGNAPWYSERSNIKKIKIEEGVTTIGNYAFYYCQKATSIELPETLESIGRYAFYYCSDLTSLTIPDSVEFIGENMAYDCDSLIKVVIGDGITEIPKYAFYACDALTTLIIGENVRLIGESSFYSCDKLLNVTLGSSVEEIGASAFRYCGDIIKVNIPKSVTKIGEYAFYDCNSLATLTLSSNLKTIGKNAFGYNGLTSLKIPNSVEELGENAFYSCDALKTVTIGTGIETIPESAFYDCDVLEKVTFGKNIVEIEDYAFYNCEKLNNVEIPAKVKSLGEYSFAYCYGMTSITFPNGLSEIEDMAFYSCRSLESVDLPDSLTMINDGVFQYCYALTSIVMHEGLEYIGEQAFYYCEDLKAIIIPSSVYGIADRAFYYCRALEKICFKGEAPAIVPDAFYNVTATCFYPSNSDTWDKTTRLDYGGTLTWKSYNKNNPPYKCNKPTIKASNVASSGKNRITWQNVKNAECYQVYRSTAKDGTYKLQKMVTGVGYTDTTAQPNKVYYYKVIAVSEYGYKSGASNIVSRRCDLKRPTLTMSNVADTGKIKISWAKINGAVKYQVYRATSKNGTYSLLKTVTGTSYINTSAKAGKTYYYKVIAVAENTAANSAYSTVKSRLCKLARPEVSITRSNGDPKLSWDKITGATKYKVYRATSKNGTYKVVTTTTSRSYKDTSAKAGKTYYYKVVAVHSNTDANSAKSVVVSIKAK